MIRPAPKLTKKQIETEVMEHLTYAKGLSVPVLWQKVGGIHARASEENCLKFLRTVESLVKRGLIVCEDGFCAHVPEGKGKF